MPIYHTLLTNSGRSCCASISRSPFDLKLRFQSSSFAHLSQDCIFENEGNEGELPWPFEPVPSKENVESAVSWVLRLDGMEAEQFSSGNISEKSIPIEAPSPTSRKLPDSLSDYRNARASVGHMIRPLFLRMPDLAPLRRFQMTGVDWLVNQPRCILADDMGLGKTVQAATALRVLFRSSPASLCALDHW